jgi:hypothetical protein
LAAKHDIQRGITVEMTATRDDIAEACRRATEPVGEYARVEPTTDQVSITILGRKQFVSKQGERKRFFLMDLGVNTSPAEDGRIRIETKVGRYKTQQSTALGFIPAGPKRLVGRTTFLKILDSLENELRALDPNADVVRS